MADPVLDDLKDIKLDEVPERKGLRKVLSILLAAFMLLIVVFYFLPGDVFSILEGRFESSKLENLTAEFDGIRIIFSAEVYEELKQLYLENQETEIMVCLKGEKVGEDYSINSSEIPKTFSATVYNIYSESCSAETLILLHTHPYKHCLFSKQDIESYEAFKKINKDAFIGLMCEADRFSFYR